MYRKICKDYSERVCHKGSRVIRWSVFNGGADSADSLLKYGNTEWAYLLPQKKSNSAENTGEFLCETVTGRYNRG